MVTEMTPKPGAEKQFEEGLTQMAAWYASNNDSQGRAVFQVAAIGHDRSADFGSPEPDEILKNAFGNDEANSILNEISALIGGHCTEEVVQFRPDLCYFLAK
ncbi:MAG: hypothetical protein WBE87_13670 [Candidatus Acidiferrales bacterium]